MTTGLRTVAAAVALLIAAVLLAGCASRQAGAEPPTSTGPCGGAAPPPTYAHVIWIFYENASLNTIIGNSAAPNINRLAAACGLARHYTGVDHPSATDYIAATSGAVHAGQGDCTPARCPDPDPSLFEQVASWKTYNGGEVTPCESDYGGDNFDVNHDPAAYYVRIADACRRNAVPLGSPTAGALVDDLAHDTLPQFAIVAPDLTQRDMHSGPVADGDAYLGALVAAIVASPAYRAGTTAVLFTYDEGESDERVRSWRSPRRSRRAP